MNIQDNLIGKKFQKELIGFITQKFLKKYNHFKLLLPISLAGFFTIYQLQNSSYWLDEIFSIYISRDLSFLFSSFVNDESNMLLYYFLLHFWLYLGDGEFTVRLLSVLPAVASVPMIYLLGRQLFNSKVGFIAALLLSVNSFMIEYAQDARAYSLLLFMAITTSYLLFRYVEKKSKRNLLLYFSTSFLAILTHFYAIFIIASHMIFLLLTKRRIIFNKVFILLGLPFAFFTLSLLFLPSFQDQGSISWIQKMQFMDLSVLFSRLSGGRNTSILSFILFLAFIPFLIRNRRLFSSNVFFVILALSLPILATIAISIFIKPTFVIRYLIICLPFFILLESHILSQITSNKLLVSILIIFMLLSIMNIKGLYGNEKESWRDAAKYVASQYKQNDIIIFHPFFAKLPFEYYLTKFHHQNGSQYFMPEITESEYRKGGGTRLPKANITFLFDQKIDNVWLIIRQDRTPNRLEQKDTITKEILSTYKLDGIKNYKMIQIELYRRREKI